MKFLSRVRFIVDKDGRVMSVEEVVKREAETIPETLLLAGKEILDSGVDFLEECTDGVGDFFFELTDINSPPRDRNDFDLLRPPSSMGSKARQKRIKNKDKSSHRAKRSRRSKR